MKLRTAMSMTSQSFKLFIAICCCVSSVAVVTTYADADAGNINKDPYVPEKPKKPDCEDETIGPQVSLPANNQGNTGTTGGALRADEPEVYEGGGYQNRKDGTFSLETPDLSIPNEELATSGPLLCVGLPLVTSMHQVVSDPEQLEPGIEQKFTVRNEKGDYETFKRPPGVTICPPAVGSNNNNRLELLDGQGQPTTGDPIICRYFPGDGSYVDYSAQSNSAPVAYVGETGRNLSVSRLEFLTSQASEIYQQVKLEEGLVDFEIVDEFSYKILFYTEADAGVKTGGEYQPTGTPYREILTEFPARNENSFDWMRTIETQGQYEQISEFRYVAAAERWAKTKGITRLGNGTFDAGTLSEHFIVNLNTIDRVNPDTNVTESIKERVIVKETRDSEGLLLSRDSERQLYFPWKGWAIVEEVQDVDGFALTTTHDYYEDPADSNSYGRHEQTVNPDGSWVRYSYDSEGRVISEVRPWLDSPVGALAVDAKEVVYDYTSVDLNDSNDVYDTRARTTIEKVLGVETSRTYNAYYNDPTTGEYTEIVERTTVQGAPYGTSTNLRNSTVYYASTEIAVLSGRIRAYTAEDGTIELHSYSEPDTIGTLIETIDLVTSSGPVAYKSKRVEKTFDPNGNQIKSEYFAYDGNAWESFSIIETDFSDELTSSGAQLLERRVDGRVVLSQTWSGPLVTSRKDRSGIQYLYSYDELDRLEMEVKLGANGAEDILTLYQREEGENGCGCDSNVKVERIAGTITLTSEQKSDSAGRRSVVNDENGYSTTYTYVDDRRITTETMPSGATRITENYLNGRTKSVTGTGVVPEYYTYTVNPDGTMTTRVEIASSSSPRYREITYDVAGRMRSSKSPAFDGGIFTRMMSYNDLGLLESQSETGKADTLYEYDALAQLIRSGLDVDGNDALDLVSTDRITDTNRFMEQDVAGDWFTVTTATVYPEFGSIAPVEVSRSKQRLTNFALATSEGDLVSESIATDVHGNETNRKIYIDRTNKTVTQIVDSPTSTIDAKTITINGLLVSQNSTTVAAPTTYGYDALERRISVKDPRHTQSSTLEYYTDSMQLFTHTDGAGNTTAYTYYPQGVNGAGQVASITDPLLQKSYRSYDELGRQIQSWGETDYPQEYTYNTYGELETLATWRDTSIDFATATWPSSTGGDTTTWTYQASTGLLTRKEYADGNGTDYSYDSANRLAVRTWARDGGLDTTYSYDPATGELLNVNYESADTADITYTYDRLGRQSTVTDATGTRSFTYDSSSLQLDGEALDATFYQGHSLTRSYEDGTETNGLIGRPSGYALKDSASSALSAVNYTYEPSTGRLSAVTDGTDTFTYAYEPNSNLLASLTAPQHTAAYTYEPNRNTMTIIDNQVSGSSLSKYTYTYDTLGRRDDRQQSGSAIAATNTDDFAYNARSEVIASTNSVETAAQWNPTYTFDQIGNRKSSTGIDSVTYTANELNQYSVLSASSAVNPTYDLDGNLETDGNWTYTWNGENRLINASNSSTNATIDFVYDYQGRLVKKNDNTNVEVYVYDGWNRIASFDAQTSNLTLQTSYTWGLDLSGSMQGAGGVGGLLKETSHNSPVTTLYSLFDANGNIMQKLDGAGTTAMSVDYDPFGNIISGTLEGEYGFSTKPLIDGMLMYYYGFRYYDPQRGRWPSRDPLGEYGGRNLYSMLGNNAISGFDLLGLATYEDLFNSLMYTASECRGKSASLDAKIDEAIAALLKKNKPFAKLLDKFSSNVGTFESFSQGLSDGVGNAIDVREFIQDIYGLKKPYDAMSSDEYADFIDPINSIIGKIKSVGDGASTLSTISKGDAIETTFALLSLVDLPGGDRLLAFGPKYLQAGYTGAKKGIKDAAITKFDDILSGIPFMCDCGDLGAAEGLFKQIHTSITKTSLFN